jgi:RND superfamily putative drug exporter
MQTLASFAIRRRWWVVAAWVIGIIAVQALSSAAGGAKYKDTFQLPHTETQTVSNLLKGAHLDAENFPSGTVVLGAKQGTLASEPASLAPALATLCSDPAYHVSGVVTPWTTITCATGRATSAATPPARGADLIDANKDVAIVNVEFNLVQPGVAPPQKVYDTLKKLNSDSLEVAFTGNSFSALTTGGGGISPQVLGFIAAFVVLILVFRTLGATVLPLVSAATALGSGLGLIALLTHVMSVASFAPNLAELMVIGVGIDYALFIVTRHRRNLMTGMSVDDSIVNAINSSGRAVLFAGTTVCIAILGLCALGVSFLYGVAIGTSIGVALTMLTSLTLLPALLRFLGLKVLPRGQRKLVRAGEFRAADAANGFWYRWARLVEKRSPIFIVVAGAMLVLLAIPFFSLRLGHADASNDPKGSTTRVGYELIEKGFGKGYNSTLELVVSGPGATDTAFLSSISTKLRTVSNINPDSISAFPASKTVALVTFKSISGPQDVATDNLVRKLRSDVLPSLYDNTSKHIYVYGQTAVYIDFAKVLSAKIIFFILAVVGLSFLLLVVAFRSLVIPLTAAAMNLLAAGASFGVVVAVFQWGWFGDTIGVGKGGPIEAFLPVLFFAILFGLSMDYQVFLVSRMHEEWIHSRDNHRAVTVGQGETGGIITAAGLIMIMVFGGFILGDGRVIKLLGIGLGSAIFLDAFIVRTMLVPSIMHRLGKWNWVYPAALEKVTPRLSIEAPGADSSDEPPAGHPDSQLAPV